MNIGPHTTAAIAELNNRPVVGTSPSVPQIRIDPSRPKFKMMQRVREEATGITYVVLGSPSDQYVIDETGESAYCITRIPTFLTDNVANPIRVISQKLVEDDDKWKLIEPIRVTAMALLDELNNSETRCVHKDTASF